MSEPVGRASRLALIVALGAALVALPARGGAQAGRSASSTPVDGAEVVARRYLASRPDLRVGASVSELSTVRVWSLTRGALVRFAQSSRGLPVLGTGISVRLDARDRAVYVASSLVRVPETFDVAPRIAAPVAIARASAQLSLAGRATSSRLAIALHLSEPRLVYEVRIARRGHDTGFVALVCAMTGVVLHVRETSIALDGAFVFLENPAVTPDLVPATLPVTPLAMTLEGEVVTASCVDPGVCTPLDWLGESAYVCRDTPLAIRDGEGDFAYTRPALDTDPTDAFAEVQAFFHVGVMLDAFRSISGDPTLTLEETTRLSTNIVTPDWLLDNLCGDATQPPVGAVLAPLDNAYFAPADDLTGEPRTLGFGQGTSVDFAYDGDVVHHEVAHAMQAEVAQIGAYYLPDAYGLRGDQGALSEGNADFWSSVVMGDPEVGEYAGAGVGSTLPSGALRSLENDVVCPRDFVGEGHEDGRVWGGVLWDIREGATQDERLEVEQGLFAAMATTTEASTMRSIAETIEDELAFRLGEATRARVHALFEARGIGSPACDSRVIAIDFPSTQNLVFLPPNGAVGSGIAPASMQFAITLTEDVERIEAAIRRVALGAPRLYGARAQASMLVKCGGEPIVWTHEEGAPHDADVTVPIEINGDVTGGSASGSAVATGRFEAGVCHVQFASEHPQLLVLVGTRLSATSALSAPPDGCGCHVPGGREEGTGLMFVFVCVGWFARRLRAAKR